MKSNLNAPPKRRVTGSIPVQGAIFKGIYHVLDETHLEHIKKGEPGVKLIYLLRVLEMA